MTFLHQEDIQYLPVSRRLVNRGESSPLFENPFIYPILAQLPCFSEMQSLQNRCLKSLLNASTPFKLSAPEQFTSKSESNPVNEWVKEWTTMFIQLGFMIEVLFSLLGLEKNTANLCLHTHTFSYGSKSKAKLTSLSSFTTNKIKYLPFGKPIQIWFSNPGNEKRKGDLTNGLGEYSCCWVRTACGWIVGLTLADIGDWVWLMKMTYSEGSQESNSWNWISESCQNIPNGKLSKSWEIPPFSPSNHPQPSS